MTDATGVSFLSYRRARGGEATLIIGSQRDRGIPTWQDTTDLGSTITEDDLRRVLTDSATAGATMFVTPDVAQSPTILNVEAPLIIERHLRNDGFTALIVAAGGLDYADVQSVLGSKVGPAYMSAWNLCKVNDNPIGEDSAARIADLMLERRIVATLNQLDSTQPLNLRFSTRSPLMKKTGPLLTADLTHRFDGRIAKPGAWEKHILSGMHAIRKALQSRAADRKILCSGQVCLPAALALGAEFLSVCGLQVSWLQDLTTFGGTQELWSLDIPPSPTKFSAQLVSGNVSAQDLAFVVSVTHNIMADVCSGFTKDFPFRALIHVHDPVTKNSGRSQLSAPEAVDLAHSAVNGLRSAWRTYGARGKVHAFLAVPAGLAFLIGQLLNGFGDIQTYEHVPTHQPCYVPAALISPSLQ